MVRWLYCKVKDTASGGIQSIVQGDNITIDNTDPLNPVVSATGGGTTGNYIPLSGTEISKPLTGPIVSGFSMDNFNTPIITTAPIDTGGDYFYGYTLSGVNGDSENLYSSIAFLKTTSPFFNNAVNISARSEYFDNDFALVILGSGTGLGYYKYGETDALELDSTLGYIYIGDINQVTESENKFAGIIGRHDYRDYYQANSYAQVGWVQEQIANAGGGTTGDYIPLSGTEVGKPVTGTVYLNNDVYFSTEDENTSFGFDGGQMFITTDFYNGGGTTSNNVYIGLYQNRLNIPDLPLYSGFFLQSIGVNGEAGVGFYSAQDHSDVVPEDKFIYAQRSYVDKANSYSIDETLTGGTWIDDKDIYTITQLTVDTPPTVDTMIKSTVVGGTYTEYEYTKLAE